MRNMTSNIFDTNNKFRDGEKIPGMSLREENMTMNLSTLNKSLKIL